MANLISYGIKVKLFTDNVNLHFRIYSISLPVSIDDKCSLAVHELAYNSLP